MSNETSPTPKAPAPADTAADTGEIIAQDIKAADAILVPLISAFDPVVGKGIDWGLKLLAIAEPAVYGAVIATLQGTPLTAEQEAALKEAETNLQTPEKYFA